MTRRNGFYWIKWQHEPEVVEYRDGIFYLCGTDQEFPEDELKFEHISDAPLTVPLWESPSQDAVKTIHALRAEVMSRASGDYNDRVLRQQIVHRTMEVMSPLIVNRAIHNFYVLCDETNNTPDVVDSGNLKWLLGVRYTPALKSAIYSVGYDDDEIQLILSGA